MALSEQLASFFATFTFKADTEKLKQVDAGLKGLSDRMNGLKAVSGKLALAIQQVVSLKFASIAAEEDKFNRLTGTLSENVDAFRLLANQANVSEETVKGAISQIARQKQDLMTMRTIPMWVRFGIDPRQSPDKILRALLEKVRRYTSDTQKQMAMLNRLGVNSELVLLFQNGSLEIDNATKNLLEFKNTNKKTSVELIANVTKLKTLFSAFLQGINGIITPLMNVAAKGLIFIVKNLGSMLAPMLTMIAEILKKISNLIITIGRKFGDYIVIILGVTAAIMAVVAITKVWHGVLLAVRAVMFVINLLSAGPIGWIALTIAAVLMLWRAIAPESFRNFFNYVQLFFKDVIDWINGVEHTVTGDFIQAIKDTFGKIKQWFVDMIDSLKQKYTDFVNFVENKVFKKINDFNTSVKEALSFKGVRNKIKEKTARVADFFNIGGKSNRVEQLNQKLIPNEQRQRMQDNKASKVNNNKVNNSITNNINVSTESNKPLDIANVVRGKLQDIRYNTRIEDEMNTASLSFNVQGAY